MKRLVLHIALTLLLFSQVIFAQTVISHFTWETSPLQAVVGPNAISVSASASVASPGKAGTLGLNPGLPKVDINLVIPGAIFDYGSIDISVDYQRDENVADLVVRGSDFSMDMKSGKLFISYRVKDGVGGYTTYVGTNIYNIPDDNIFRTFQFYYDEALGKADVNVDGVNVWSNVGLLQPLYWNPLSNVMIGSQADGAGSNKPIFDNFIVKTVNSNALPIVLTSFDAKAIDDESIKINWLVQSEINNDYFLIQQSENGIDFVDIKQVQGRGTSTTAKEYSTIDNKPYYPQTYYRLIQVDFDGKSWTSDVICVKTKRNFNGFEVYPNPFSNSITVSSSEKCNSFSLYTIEGKTIFERAIPANNTVDLSSLPMGIYFLVACGANKKRTIVKDK